MGANCSCGTPKVETVNVVADAGPMDETAPTLLTQPAKYSDKVTQVQRPPVAPSAPEDPTTPEALPDASLDCVAGTWFQADGTRMGQIEENLLTWACDLPPSEVRLSPSGEVLIEVDGEVYKASFKDDALHFNDGDIWTKAAPATQ